MSKPWLVLFEGQDESGKTTLLKAFNEYTNFKHTVVDRAFISTAVYNIKFKRDNDSIDYLVQLRDISKVINVLVVLCKADPNIIRARYRCSDKNDYISKNEETLMSEIEEDGKLFEHYADLCNNSCKVLKLDTSNIKISDQVAFIENIINKYEVIE